MKRSKCLICDSEKLIRVIKLGMHPFADSFISEKRYSESEKVYPLNCMLCEECGHLQNEYLTSPNDRYSDHEYSYTSSNSNFSKNHWMEFSNIVFSKIPLNGKTQKVLEIGSNDGFLGIIAKEKGYEYIGVDASPHMVSLAKKNKIETICGLFGKEIKNKLKDRFNSFELIIANNVLNHADNLKEFIDSVEKLLSKNGIFVF